jgi:hypothetical protein
MARSRRPALSTYVVVLRSRLVLITGSPTPPAQKPRCRRNQALLAAQSTTWGRLRCRMPHYTTCRYRFGCLPITRTVLSPLRRRALGWSRGSDGGSRGEQPAHGAVPARGFPGSRITRLRPPSPIRQTYTRPLGPSFSEAGVAVALEARRSVRGAAPVQGGMPRGLCAGVLVVELVLLHQRPPVEAERVAVGAQEGRGPPDSVGSTGVFAVASHTIASGAVRGMLGERLFRTRSSDIQTVKFKRLAAMYTCLICV